MGTPGAERHFPLGQLQLGGGFLLRQGNAGEGGDGGGHVVRVQLADLGQGPVVPAPERDCEPVLSGQGLQVLFQEGVHLLQDQHLFGGLEVAQYVLLRQRPEGPQGQEARLVFGIQPLHGLLGVEPPGAAGHDEPLRVLGPGVVVVGAVLKLAPQCLQPLQHGRVEVGHAHQPVPLPHSLDGVGLFRQGPQPHHAPAVAHPGGEPDDHHLPRALGELEGIGHDVLGLLHGGGLQQRDAGGFRLPAGVKLVGAGVSAGIVRGHDHKPALDAVLGAAVQGVRRAEKPVLLHDAKGPGPRQRRAHARLQRADLVGGPLGVEIPLPGDFAQHSQHLGGRGAGVRGGEVDSSLHRAADNGLVALH